MGISASWRAKFVKPRLDQEKLLSNSVTSSAGSWQSSPTSRSAQGSEESFYNISRQGSLNGSPRQSESESNPLVAAGVTAPAAGDIAPESRRPRRTPPWPPVQADVMLAMLAERGEISEQVKAVKAVVCAANPLVQQSGDLKNFQVTFRPDNASWTAKYVPNKCNYGDWLAAAFAEQLEIEPKNPVAACQDFWKQLLPSLVDPSKGDVNLSNWVDYALSDRPDVDALGAVRSLVTYAAT